MNEHKSLYPKGGSTYGPHYPAFEKPLKHEPPIEPAIGSQELLRSFVRPHKMIEIVLSRWKELTSNVAEGRHLAILALLLIVISLVASIPYGAVLGIDQIWKIAVLYLGSVMICFPSLHIFGSFVGLRNDFAKSLTFAVIISAVASLFTLGFAPILWFLSATIDDKESHGTVHILSVTFLVVAVFAGIFQLARCLYYQKRLVKGGFDILFITSWQFLLLFITIRMGVFLDLM